MSYSYVIKLILLGDSATGKTSFLNRFVNEDPLGEYETTIGVDFQAKTILSAGGRYMRLHLWDTAGQETFRSIVSSYYKCVAGAIIFFDITNRQTFQNVSHWLTEFRNKNTLYQLPIIIVGNKKDIDKREVSFQEATKYANENEAIYTEISVKNNIGIYSVIQRITDKIEEVIINNDCKCDGIRPGNKSSFNNKLQLDQRSCRVGTAKWKCCIQS
jgi:small GTP-binding protein